MSDNNKTILIIEDEETILNMYRLKFEASGFNFLGATTGEEGLKMASQQKCDVIFVDLMLENKVEGGVISGYDVISKLRKNNKLSKIYALTNFDQDKSIEQAFKIGVDGYLLKSNLIPSELVAKTRKILAGEKVGVKI